MHTSSLEPGQDILTVPKSQDRKYFPSRARGENYNGVCYVIYHYFSQRAGVVEVYHYKLRVCNVIGREGGMESRNSTEAQYSVLYYDRPQVPEKHDQVNHNIVIIFF